MGEVFSRRMEWFASLIAVENGVQAGDDFIMGV